MKKLGIIVNPVAGMGGKVGLKGTDGVQVLSKARKLGAKPESPERTVEALNTVSRIRDRIEVVTYPSEMGEEECVAAGLSPRVIGSILRGETTPEDTRRGAQEIMAEGVDLLLFAGGDGTARDICDAVGEGLLTLGIPAGVKIHSGVFAVTPRSAGEVALRYLDDTLRSTRVAEVMDIDEDAFRSGMVRTKLYGYLRVPEESQYIQSVKFGGFQTEKETLQSIAADVIECMDDKDCYFIIGPGTTTRVIMEILGLKNTLLGVDVVLNKQIVANDVAEEELMRLIREKKAKIVVTVIGGQGHIFGRGNQQISPRVIRQVGRENIIVMATKEKLISLDGRPLLVDTGDQELNEELSGYMRVTTGYSDYIEYKVGY